MRCALRRNSTPCAVSATLCVLRASSRNTVYPYELTGLLGRFVEHDLDGAVGLRFAGAIPNKDLRGNAVTAVPAQNDYGWVQTDGYHSAIKTNGDDDIAQDDTLIMVATDGVVDSIAKATTTGTLLLVGYAADVDADATNTVPAYLVRGEF